MPRPQSVLKVQLMTCKYGGNYCPERCITLVILVLSVNGIISAIWQDISEFKKICNIG